MSYDRKSQTGPEGDLRQKMGPLWKYLYGLQLWAPPGQTRSTEFPEGSEENKENTQNTLYHHFAQCRADVLSPILQQITFPFRSSDPDDLSGHISDKGAYPTRLGGYSDIWKCTWVKGKERIAVAVKSIRLDVENDADKERTTRKLRQEFNIWKCVQHENVLPLYGVTGGFGPLPALVSLWAADGTLTSYLELKHDRLSICDRFRILSQVASGLKHLHYKDIVHGDLTGSNVLVDDGKIYISDFGLSRILVEMVGSSVYSSSKGGAVRWAAPELFEPQDYEEEASSTTSNAVVPSMQTDLYSFGCIMLQVLSGKIPYHYIRSDHQVLVAMIKGSKPCRPKQSYITDRSWNFIQRCWLPHGEGAPRPSIDEAAAFVDNPC